MSAALQHESPSFPGRPDGFRSTGPGFVGSRGKRADNLVLRLASEGIPLTPIARVTQRSLERVMSTVQQALDQRILTQAPPIDWPESGPTAPATLAQDAELLARAERIVPRVMRAFATTRRQHALFIALLVTHGAIGRPTLVRLLVARKRAARETLGTVASHVRHCLAERGIVLVTVYGQGFSLNGAGRRAAWGILAAVPDEAPEASDADLSFLAALAEERDESALGAAC